MVKIERAIYLLVSVTKKSFFSIDFNDNVEYQETNVKNVEGAYETYEEAFRRCKDLGYHLFEPCCYHKENEPCCEIYKTVIGSNNVYPIICGATFEFNVNHNGKILDTDELDCHKKLIKEFN